MGEPALISGLIEVAPGEVQLVLESGYLFMEMGKYREAEEVFGGVAAMLPNSEIPLVCLGNLQFAQGRFERALKFHKDAISRNPESALAHAHVGESLIFLNRKKEAKTVLDKAIALDPEGPAAAFANSLLDGMVAEVIG